MVNIEPYTFQKVTNIKEHNDIVNKLNETIDFVNDIGDGRIFHAMTITLKADEWENGNQIIQIEGMTETATVWVASAIVSAYLYTDAGIQAINQGANYLMFNCTATPNVDIYVTVVFTEI